MVDAAAVSRWVRAFVARDAVYWPRETQLVVKAIVQPGDRVREFRDGQLKHPRGVDLVLLVEAPEGTKVPAAVELNYALDGGRGTGRMEMVKSHERQFRHTISGCSTASRCGSRAETTSRGLRCGSKSSNRLGSTG